MKKLLVVFTIAAVFGACGNKNQEKENTQKSESKECASMSVDSFLVVADNYVDKVVTITGTVDHVCKHGGKRVRMFTNNPEVSIHGEATEEVGAFDATLEGSDICITGPVVESRIDIAYVDEWESKVKEAMENNNEEAEMEHKAGADHHATLETIKDYRKQIEESEKGYISFYAVNVNEYHDCAETAHSPEGCAGNKVEGMTSEKEAKPCCGDDTEAKPCGAESKEEAPCGNH